MIDGAALMIAADYLDEAGMDRAAAELRTIGLMLKSARPDALILLVDRENNALTYLPIVGARWTVGPDDMGDRGWIQRFSIEGEVATIDDWVRFRLWPSGSLFYPADLPEASAEAESS